MRKKREGGTATGAHSDRGRGRKIAATWGLTGKNGFPMIEQRPLSLHTEFGGFFVQAAARWTFDVDVHSACRPRAPCGRVQLHRWGSMVVTD